MASGRWEDKHVLDAARLATACHEIIASLLKDGIRKPSLSDIAALANRHPAVQSAPRPQAARQRAMACVSAYFRFFGPEADWQFAGAEVSTAGGRLDVVWQDGAERYLIDEIKAGRLSARDARDATARQVKKYLGIGAENWGDQFAGVRVLFLGTPRYSYIAAADGTAVPFTWEGVK
jgi:hypothetical protein